MVVVAEGIETPDQLAQLLVLGCGFGQGFLLGAPVAARRARTAAREQLVPRDAHRHGRERPLRAAISR